MTDRPSANRRSIHRRSIQLQRYLAAIGSLLWLQGILVLLLMGLSISLPSPLSRAVPPDPLHAIIHIAWGFLLGLSLLKKREQLAGFGFSLFYLSFALVGVLSENPLGLLLGKGENGFHLVVGAIALVLTFRSITQPNP